MTIRTRLSLWYAATMFIALLAMGALSDHEFVFEPRREAAVRPEATAAVAEEEGDFRDILRIVLWCGVPAGMLALGGGWWLMRQALAPVTALTHAAGQLHEGNLKERLTCSGNGDELDRLTEVFNAMTARLDNSFAQVREFTLHASHELKTPLTVLCGEMETALRDATLTPIERERSASQLDELRRLGRIVDGLTLLTRADAGLLRLAFEPVRFDELVRDNFADAELLAQASGVEVKLAACEPARMLGDRHRLRQLLLNLADNAVKYNRPQGRVTMALLHDDKTAEFVITNTGPGIPSEILPRVFDRFFRGDPAHDNTVEGCGLGLSIAQWIVRAHNGSIEIASVPLQQTTVTVRLPLAGK